MTVPRGDVTTVVLDLGNVLVGWDPRRVWAGTRTDAEIDRFLADTDFDALNRSLDGGRPYADARAEVLRRWPHHVATLDDYWTGFPASLTGPVPGTEELVRGLRDAGMRLLGLTNWSAETFHHAQSAAPAIGMLQDVLVSGRVGLAKPDPAIFRLLVREYGLDPARTLFVDDSAANVDAAALVGLLTHLFSTAQLLREDLLARGIALPS